MTIHLSYDRAVELLGRAVTEKGADYVYEDAVNCAYFGEHGEPRCIVGHVLHYVGVEPFDPDDVHNITSFGVLMEEGVVSPVTADERAINLLVTAQVHQDRQVPWGESVENAKKETAEE